ncbi:hypothetical protein [Campylobacter cuniculorum]|uniref:Amidophosphoribosyltransferase n=2 Tax=Campylobacter cuniculorum TaxID=374106 RepID=A0ABX6TZ36_9BACT|nr:hypothetical protein [Campylobacter cuniculorum]ARJ57265.1 putative amidophosphoribosyltransferase [Campylobacter cuniculorum DSM 23162 = LMG 24588]QOR04701.1 amidophosphoribosyltransferase [Campylobacter cuniculorum]
MEELKSFDIETNGFLRKESVCGWYHRDYTNYKLEGNPDFLVTLKNTSFQDGQPHQNEETLNRAKDEAKSYIYDILKRLEKTYTICVVPRSKANFTEKQLYFRKAVKEVVNELRREGSPIIDGTDFIQRHTNTRTTHLSKKGFDKEGKMPYVGITLETCDIDDRVKGCDIILIDDIYTKTANVIEDCVQALFDKGAKRVAVYCVARTIDKSK